MVASVIARVVIRYRELCRRRDIYLNNTVISHSLGSIKYPFDIDPSTEFRNPTSISIAENCTIKKNVILDGRSCSPGPGIVFGPETYIKEYCYIDAYGGKIYIDGYSAIGQFCILAGQGSLQIGKYVMLGGHCYILTSNHITESLDVPYMMQGDRCTGVVIEDNVWIGGGSIVLDGVRIGRNSIVGAGSIVTTDIPPNSMYIDRNPRLLKGVLLRLLRKEDGVLSKLF